MICLTVLYAKGSEICSLATLLLLLVNLTPTQAMLDSPNVEPEYGLEADGENLIDTTDVDVSAFGLSAFTRA
ncbi:1,4-beta-D-xylan synthase [Trifolium repens]|nr:1,4-beta-D-xylan synthase [Trifolium repens]